MSTASVETIAKLLDMTPRRVQQLATEGVVPKPEKKGQYEIVPASSVTFGTCGGC
ncbi:MAG: hypothetical protein LBF61_12465 [Azoarcus sp.]|jgi:NADH:ubiquinone oxidoreductase subunit E|nr:hypothetical protein [Azoarcus sp.]